MFRPYACHSNSTIPRLSSTLRATKRSNHLQKLQHPLCSSKNTTWHQRAFQSQFLAPNTGQVQNVGLLILYVDSGWALPGTFKNLGTLFGTFPKHSQNLVFRTSPDKSPKLENPDPACLPEPLPKLCAQNFPQLSGPFSRTVPEPGNDTIVGISSILSPTHLLYHHFVIFYVRTTFIFHFPYQKVFMPPFSCSGDSHLIPSSLSLIHCCTSTVFIFFCLVWLIA